MSEGLNDAEELVSPTEHEPPVEDTDNAKRAKSIQEKRQWLDCASFSALPPEAKEALLQFARDRNLTTDIRRLEFWFSSPDDSSLAPLLNKYLSDGEDQLPEVQESDNTDEVIEHARELDAYVSRLKERMRPRLNETFRKFKDHLAAEIKRELEMLS